MLTPKKLDDEAGHAVAVDLLAVARELHAETAGVGHVARTILREPDLRVVVIAMNGGATIAEHHATHTASVQVLYGHIRLQLPDRPIELATSQLVSLARGVAHDVVALEPSAFVLTLAWSAA